MEPVDSKTRCLCGYRATSLRDLREHMAEELETATERVQWAYEALTSSHVMDNEHRLGALGAGDIAHARRALVPLLPRAT